MAAIDFPNSPTVNQVFTAGTSTYKWTGTAWISNNLGSIAWTDVTGKPTTFTPSAHTHVKADVTDFAHTHVKADVTDFAHTHATSEVTGLDSALAGKAATSHTHTLSQITDYVPPSTGNVIINGAFDVWQRGTSFSSSGYTVDRWQPYATQASKLVSSQSTTVPAGFKYSYLTTSSSAYTPVTGDYFMQTTRIEGYNTASFAFGTSSAKNLTLSFWVRSSLTGTFGGAMHNNAFDRTFVFSYTISAANTWEYKTVSIAGDTAGTWDNTTAVGLEIGFSLGTTAALSTTAGSWVSGVYWGVTGQVNVISTNGATWQVTGVQLEAGSVATPFRRNAPSLQGELAACQRYCVVYGGNKVYERLAIGSSDSTTSARMLTVFPVPMRATPSLTIPTLSDWQVVLPGVVGVLMTSLTLSTDESSPYMVTTTAAFSSNGNFGSSKSVVIAGNGTTNAKAIFSAEL